MTIMSTADRAVAYWLCGICVVVFLMIIVGGVTRLTHSGLSMVDWKPILGSIPPLNQQDWQAAFDAYKQFPEYQKVNHGMVLEEFKFIYLWEYSHRLLGRFIGIVFFIPFVILAYLKMIRRSMMPKLLFAFVLGGLQGLMGWYMVKSGLVDLPRVSHFRLAAHLMLAMFLMAYLYWLILDLLNVQVRSGSAILQKLLYSIIVLFVLQVLYGAFVAGLRAGLGFNTFPLMDGQLLAEAATTMSPWLVNFVENGAMVQFVHRWIAVVLVGMSIAGLTLSLKDKGVTTGWAVLTALIAVQFVLGVSTLVLYVPIAVASLHQAGAVIVMLALVYLLYTSKTAR